MADCDDPRSLGSLQKPGGQIHANLLASFVTHLVTHLFQPRKGHAMELRYVFRMLLASPFLAPCIATHSAGAASSWTYAAHRHGPRDWGVLETAFEKCATGLAQSPIDIGKTVKANLPALDFQYGKAALSILNNGHTVQVDLPAGNVLKVGDQSLELLQFHFHTPSEETLKGKHLPMVVHFVHRAAGGELGVVSVLVKVGRSNADYAPVFAHLPRPGEKIAVDALELDLPRLLPSGKGYYAYQGSLTTPPCSEGVNWMILKNPIVLGAGQVKAFRRLFSANARPVQPLHGRIVEESQ
jgi:carbonic anhydrase